MSFCPDGRSIRCDGDDCDRVRPLPVMRGAARAARSERWLSVVRGAVVQHYCPSCARCRESAEAPSRVSTR